MAKRPNKPKKPTHKRHGRPKRPNKPKKPTHKQHGRAKRPNKPTHKQHGKPKRAKRQVAGKRKGPKGILADDFDDSSDFAFAKVSADAFNQCRGVILSECRGIS